MLNYYSIGNVNKECIVFLHGFMGNSSEWQYFMRILSENYYCISFDLPGHGKSINLNDDNYLIESTCNYIYNILQIKGITRINLIGYSFGGRVALTFANMYKEMIGHLIIISTSPGIQSEQARKERIIHDSVIANALKTKGIREFLFEWYKNPIFVGIQKELLERIIADKMNNSIPELCKSLKYAGTGNMKPLWTFLPELEFPILQIVGENDSKFCSINIQMKEKFSKSKLIVIPNTSHYVHLEKSEYVLKQMYNCLTNNIDTCYDEI